MFLVDIKDRIKFMEENYDLHPSQACLSVENEDKRSMNLYHKFGREDYDKPNLYHLVLDMNKISVEKAIELIIKWVSF